MKTRYIVLYTLGSLLITWPQTVSAYVGPGAGLSAIGTALALIGAILLGIVGFLWYPIKRMLRAIRKPVEKPDNHERSHE